MREDRIGTLRLEGEDAVNFVNSFLIHLRKTCFSLPILL